MEKQSLAEGCCTPVDIARQRHSCSYLNRFSLFAHHHYHPGLLFITMVT